MKKLKNYNLHFFHRSSESGIKSRLQRLQINTNLFRYHLSSELLTQKDAVYHALIGYQWTVPFEKKHTIDSWLASFKCTKQDISPTKSQAICLNTTIDALYLTVVWNLLPILDFSFDVSMKNNQLIFPEGFNLILMPNTPNILHFVFDFRKMGTTLEAIKHCSGFLDHFIVLLHVQMNMELAISDTQYKYSL